MARYNERELYAKALLIYDTGSRPLIFEEFAADVNRIVCFCKLLKQHKVQAKAYNRRLLLNWMVTSFNIFGLDTVNLLFTIADEMIYPEILSFLFFLGKFPPSQKAVTVDETVVDLSVYAMNTELYEDLVQETSKS